MMRKWGAVLMLTVMLAIPVLACGFPFPAGTTMMRVSKAVCAQGEPVESCQARQDAYQLMGKLQSAAVSDLQMELIADIEGSSGTIQITGAFEYEVTASDEHFGANLHVWIEDGLIDFGDDPIVPRGWEFIIIGDQWYQSEDGGLTWTVEELTPAYVKFLGLMLGVGGSIGAGLDLYTDPAVFSVTAENTLGDAGQPVIVQTLSINLAALLGNPATLTDLMRDAFDAGGSDMGMTEENLGMTIEEFAGLAMFIVPFLQGTGASTVLHIGVNDGYIHYMAETFNFNLDMTVADPTQAPMSASYALSGRITRHNEVFNITAPIGATPGEEGGGLFGDGGLGSSLFTGGGK